MTYAVLSDHPEALHDGRLVESGERISDSDAQKNPRLIERGVLVKEEPKQSKPHPKKESGAKAGHESAAAPQEEESK